MRTIPWLCYGSNLLPRKLDLVLSRLGKIEEEMGRQASVLAGNPGQGLWPPVPFFSLTIMYSDDSAIRSETAAPL